MRFKYYLRGAGIGVIVATLILSVAFLFQDNISDEEVIRRAMKLGMVMNEDGPGTLADLQQPGDSAVDLESGTDDGRQPDEDALNGSGDTGADGQTDVSGGNTAADDQNGASGAGTDGQNGNGTDAGADGQSGNGADAGADGQDGNSGADKAAEDTSGSDDKKPSGSGASDSDKPSEDKPPKEDSKPSGDKPSDKDDKPSGNKPEDGGQGSGDEQSDEVTITIESGDVSRMVSAKVFEAGLVDSADEFNSYLGAHDYDNKLQPGTHKIPKGSSFRQIAQILTSR